MPKLFFISLIMLSFLTASAPAFVSSTQLDPQELNQRFNEAYEAKQWGKAAEFAEQLADTDVGARIGAYNAACAHSMNNNEERACEWLILAAERGFSGVRSLEEDDDLANIREHEQFQIAYKLVKENVAKRLAEYQAAARADDALTIIPDDLDIDARPPLLIVLHGSGGTPEPLAEIYIKSANDLGMILVVPAALRPWGDGFGWTYRDESEWRVLDLIERYQASHNIDPDRVYLAGFSQGANVTLAVGLKHPDKFAGLFPVCGHYESDVMPITESESRPPIYLMIGSRDPFVQTFRDAVMPLKDAGFPVKLRILQGTEHAYPKRADSELRKGFNYLFKAASD